MVEESREIRDRGFLATMLLTGGVALAAGLFQMFILGQFSAAPIFDSVLGMFMIFVGVLFIAPYMTPGLIGLPAPGMDMVTRPYLPYPVPVPSGAAPTAPRVPAAAPRAARNKAPAPAPARPSTFRPLRTSSASFGSEDLASLEALGHEDVGAVPLPQDYQAPPPLTFKTVLADQLAPAEYLEEVTPAREAPEDTAVPQALVELQGLAGRAPSGGTPVPLVNGIGAGPSGSDSALLAMQELLRQPVPGEASPGAARAPPAALPVAPIPAAEGVSEVEHLHADLTAFPPAEASRGPPILPQFPGESSPIKGGPAPEGPSPPSLVPPAVAAPLPEPAPSPTPAAAAAITVPTSADVGEDELTGMAETIEGMLKAARSETVAPAPSAAVAGPASPVAPETHETAEDASAGHPAEHASELLAPETVTEEASGDSPGIEDLERELASMRSALVASPSARALPEIPRGPRPSTRASMPPVVLGATAPPDPSPETTEDDLQSMLDEAESAAQMTKDRHEKLEKGQKTKKRSA